MAREGWHVAEDDDFDVEKWISESQRVTLTVRVCTRGDLLDELEQAKACAGDGRLSGAPTVHAVLKKIEEATVPVTVQAVDYATRNTIADECTVDSAGADGEGPRRDLDMVAFTHALVAASVVSPRFKSPSVVQRWRVAAGEGPFTTVLSAVERVCGNAVTVPVPTSPSS